MKGTKAALPYATALVELAEEKGALDAVYQDMQFFYTATKGSEELQLFLNNPIIHSSKKKEVLDAIFAAFHPVSGLFVKTITQNKRENILFAVSKTFIDIYKHKKGIVPVTLTTAHPLDAKTKEIILSKIDHLVKGDIELTEKVDESLIGGFVVHMQDKRIDASVASQFKELKQRLTQ